MDIMETTDQLRLSIVIPVYNSAGIIAQTIDRTVAFCESAVTDYELILVNDNSRDTGWEIVRERAAANPKIIAISFLKNYGQHTALICGMKASSGDYVVTMDDDLQNPPEEIRHLLDKAFTGSGHDVVFGRFREKNHPGYRRAGSRVIQQLNRHLFNCPDDLIVSNFRLLRRDVVDRICAYRTAYPYITGMTLMFAANPANEWVEHQPRSVGKSSYSPIKLLRFVMRLLFSYSALPLWAVGIGGGALVLIGFVLMLLLMLFGQNPLGVALVTLIVAALTLILMLAMLGEYVMRLMRQLASDEIYLIKERIH